ncbi:Mss4-like protein [Phaeosphaeriaceae sp. PMI808]|nr:Mss4-like protein [Phaeosphaeriaceae sp. PMI808]
MSTPSNLTLPTLPDPSAPSKTYSASCHCGAFKYTVKTSPPLSSPEARLSQCNCTICTRNGYLNIYPATTDITFLKGSFEDFRSYKFGSHKIEHYFCGTCGASCMARSCDPTFFVGMTCVNVRMMEAKEWVDVQRKHVNGASL